MRAKGSLPFPPTTDPHILCLQLHLSVSRYSFVFVCAGPVPCDQFLLFFFTHLCGRSVKHPLRDDVSPRPESLYPTPAFPSSHLPHLHLRVPQFSVKRCLSRAFFVVPCNPVGTPLPPLPIFLPVFFLLSSRCWWHPAFRAKPNICDPPFDLLQQSQVQLLFFFLGFRRCDNYFPVRLSLISLRRFLLFVPPRCTNYSFPLR